MGKLCYKDGKKRQSDTSFVGARNTFTDSNNQQTLPFNESTGPMELLQRYPWTARCSCPVHISCLLAPFPLPVSLGTNSSTTQWVAGNDTSLLIRVAAWRDGTIGTREPWSHRPGLMQIATAERFFISTSSWILTRPRAHSIYLYVQVSRKDYEWALKIGFFEKNGAMTSFVREQVEKVSFDHVVSLEEMRRVISLD